MFKSAKTPTARKHHTANQTNRRAILIIGLNENSSTVFKNTHTTIRIYIQTASEPLVAAPHMLASSAEKLPQSHDEMRGVSAISSSRNYIQGRIILPIGKISTNRENDKIGISV